MSKSKCCKISSKPARNFYRAARLAQLLIGAILFAAATLGAVRYVVRKIDWKLELQFKVWLQHPPAWMEKQIQDDLAAIQSEDLSPDQLDLLMEQERGRGGYYALARYQIRGGKLHTSYLFGLGEHPRARSIEQSLREIVSVVAIPDVDFVISLIDYADRASFTAPVFAFAKDGSLQEPILLMPDFEALEGNKPFLKEVEKGSAKYPWEKKISKAFWRGAMTGIPLFEVGNFLNAPRSQLIALSQSNPDWLDARYSAVTQTHEPEKIQETFADFFGKGMSISEHLAYKYQILADGNSCAYSRGIWQLFSNCLTFKQHSPNIQWYYRAIKPWVHYIPVRSDFGDLIDQLKWANDHDAEVETIIKRAQGFAKQNLKKSDIRYYMVLLLKAYAKKQAPCYTSSIKSQNSALNL